MPRVPPAGRRSHVLVSLMAAAGAPETPDRQSSWGVQVRDDRTVSRSTGPVLSKQRVTHSLPCSAGAVPSATGRVCCLSANTWPTPASLSCCRTVALSCCSSLFHACPLPCSSMLPCALHPRTAGAVRGVLLLVPHRAVGLHRQPHVVPCRTEGRHVHLGHAGAGDVRCAACKGGPPLPA